MVAKVKALASKYAKAVVAAVVGAVVPVVILALQTGSPLDAHAVEVAAVTGFLSAVTVALKANRAVE